jgi:CO/xanthine dehydrogenase FAD-binding subunit
MSDTRVITAEFDCRVPATVAQATQALEQEGARVLAGGTDLINAIKTNLARPRCLVYSLGIEEIRALSWNGGRGTGLSIGAALSLADIEHDPKIGAVYPALVEAVNVIGGVQIRNMATLAGNLCNASPGADTPPVLLVMGAEVEIAGKGGRRRLALESFFTGPKQTVLSQGEMLTAVILPTPPAASGAAFRRLARVSLDIAKINCAAYLERDGDRIVTARVALGSVAPTPVRAPSVEAALAGKKAGEELFREAAPLSADDITPITDIRSTEDYRRQVAAVLVREALGRAWQRAGGR